MRSRAVREGSVGLLLLLGMGIFIAIFLWIRGLTVGERSYSFTVEFPRVNGLLEGAAVRYRGVTIGRIASIRPQVNGVEVTVEISPANVVIARDAIIEANQSGFLGEVSVDITPQREVPTEQVTARALDPKCDRALIVCNGSRLTGEIGVSTDELIRFTTRFASVYSNQELYENINAAIENTSIVAADVSRLTRELTTLTKSTRQQLDNLAVTADRITATTNKTASQFGATANQVRLTAEQANDLIANLNRLVTENRTSLVATLDNLTQTSKQLRSSVETLTPTVNRVTQGQLIENLETLTANATEASTNLRDASKALNSPSNVLALQQTLDSARVTFQNAQKITSDLDELTGDPSFRDSIRQLIEGLSGLVSSTQQVEQQVQVANTLDSVAVAAQERQGGIAVGRDGFPNPPVRESGVGSWGQERQGSNSSHQPLATNHSLLTPRTETPQWLLKLKESVKQDK
ncbi:MCE family protein [Chroococcidiopsis sp. FACHB-1243]|uniref:MlaD family protein n=1 Tax=Chroococcidiopsis sp. [FACHB-1243] TaxID=2692781 RepID=UPI0017868995|nr:MlaD family protein [Chroococcidiopsis sp. [FACHB-1243]]MBD2305417.1 MCE family protein [Chroococcidiopsis sp. [FACHB-1243]]